MSIHILPEAHVHWPVDYTLYVWCEILNFVTCFRENFSVINWNMQECEWTSAAVHLMSSRHWQCSVKNYLQITQSKLIHSIHKYSYHAQLHISFLLLPLPLPTQFYIVLVSYHSNMQQKCLQNSRSNIQQRTQAHTRTHTHTHTHTHILPHCKTLTLSKCSSEAVALGLCTH
jgi:hypothetical protein